MKDKNTIVGYAGGYLRAFPHRKDDMGTHPEISGHDATVPLNYIDGVDIKSGRLEIWHRSGHSTSVDMGGAKYFPAELELVFIRKPNNTEKNKFYFVMELENLECGRDWRKQREKMKARMMNLKADDDSIPEGLKFRTHSEVHDEETSTASEKYQATIAKGKGIILDKPELAKAVERLKEDNRLVREQVEAVSNELFPYLGEAAGTLRKNSGDLMLDILRAVMGD